MQVFVKTLTGATITVPAVLTTTIGEVKMVVWKRLGLPASSQRMVYAGKQLEDSRCLLDYNIQNECTFHLVLSLRGGSNVSTDVVKRYAPVFRFHPNEPTFPCSIEYLLKGATMNYRNFTRAAKVDGKISLGRPSIAYFRSQLFMVYIDSKSSQLGLTCSNNGSDWDNSRILQWSPSPKPLLPSLAVFLGRLWIVFSESKTSQLWVTHSEDGQTFSPPQQVSNQKGLAPVVTAFESNLIVVYRDVGGSQLWMSQSNGSSSWSDPQRIEGQQAVKISLTVFNDKLVMVYTNARNSELCVSQYTSASGWNTPSKIRDKGAAAPALATIDGWLCTVFRDRKGSQLWASRSRDAITWQDTTPIVDQIGSKPALGVISGVLIIVYGENKTCDTRPSQLWVTRSQGGDFSVHPPLGNVTQALLQQNSNEQFYIKVNPSQHSGQRLPTAPLYYAVQDHGNSVEITYIVLYAYQGGQTARGLRAGTEFNCVLPNLGTHQGDLERVTVMLTKGENNTYSVARVSFEGHGQTTDFTPDQVKWEDTSHPIVHLTLNSHAMRNLDPATSDHHYDVNIPGLVAIGDWVGTGQWWRPHSDDSDFKLLGLDSTTQQPIGDQVWAAFQGNLGENHNNTLVSGTYFNGKRLSVFDWAFVKMVYAGGVLIKKIPLDKLVGDGPTGPARRSWVYTTV